MHWLPSLEVTLWLSVLYDLFNNSKSHLLCQLGLLHSSTEFQQQHIPCCPLCSSVLTKLYSMVKSQLTSSLPLWNLLRCLKNQVAVVCILKNSITLLRVLYCFGFLLICLLFRFQVNSEFLKQNGISCLFSSHQKQNIERKFLKGAKWYLENIKIKKNTWRKALSRYQHLNVWV